MATERAGDGGRRLLDLADRLTLISIGAIVTMAIVNGTCTSNERFRDLQARMTSLDSRVESGFSAAANERREEHGQIIRRLERLEDLHLKGPGVR